jgi:hypothetical protein
MRSVPVRRATREDQGLLRTLGAEVPRLGFGRRREWLLAGEPQPTTFLELSFQRDGQTKVCWANDPPRKPGGLPDADLAPGLLDAAIERASKRGCSLVRVDGLEWGGADDALSARGFVPMPGRERVRQLRLG